jgi:plasmid replication initiation protein
MKEVITTKTAIQRTSKKSDVIIKSRDLNEAHFPNFGLNEYRLFSLILSKAIRVDKNNPKEFFKAFYETHIITPKEFSEIFDVHITNCHRILKSCGKTLFEKKIKIKNKEMHIFESREYDEKKHQLEIRLSLGMIEHLDITTRYVKTILYQIAKFRSVYSIRLYELVTSFRNLGKISISVEKLRLLLGVDKDKLKEYKHFKSIALIPAINEVNKVCNFDIKHAEKKESRKVAIINFTCKKPKKKELDDEYIDNNKALSITHEEDVTIRLINIGVEKKIVNKYKNCSDAKLEKAYKAIKKAIESKTLRTTTTAYFRYLIEI